MYHDETSFCKIDEYCLLDSGLKIKPFVTLDHLLLSHLFFRRLPTDFF